MINMRYFLVKLKVDVTEGGAISYVRPKWYKDAGLGQYESRVSYTTTADSFVDVVAELPDDETEYIAMMEDSFAVELSEDDYLNWKKYKETILKMVELENKQNYIGEPE